MFSVTWEREIAHSFAGVLIKNEQSSSQWLVFQLPIFFLIPEPLNQIPQSQPMFPYDNFVWNCCSSLVLPSFRT